jgi:hypothetical protein
MTPRRTATPREGEFHTRGGANELRGIVAWYLRTAYGRWEGPGCTPFYASPAHVGTFAVDLDLLRARCDAELFKLFVLLGFYQARRDTLVMRLQRNLSATTVKELSSSSRLGSLVGNHYCERLESARSFESGCALKANDGVVECEAHPGRACHVKQASLAFRRMADMGKLPTSAWFHIGQFGIGAIFAAVCKETKSPKERAGRLVQRLATVHRVGQKLASLYVTILCTPELQPGFSPWSPECDGSNTLVLDTNVLQVARAILSLSGNASYSAVQAAFLRVAMEIDLKELSRKLPNKSPRLVQQAVYVFRSRSNRIAMADACARAGCHSCPSDMCPFSKIRTPTLAASHCSTLTSKRACR